MQLVSRADTDTDGQTDMPSCVKTDRQTDRQIDRHNLIHKNRQANIPELDRPVYEKHLSDEMSDIFVKKNRNSIEPIYDIQSIEK